MQTAEDLQQELTPPLPEPLTVINLGDLPIPSTTRPKLKAEDITLEQLRSWEENSDLESVSVASQLMVERTADLMKENIELELAKQQQAAELAQLRDLLEQERVAKCAAEERAEQEAAARSQQQAMIKASLVEKATAVARLKEL